MKHISIAKDFSVYPAGRMKEDGPFTGEGFREKFLVPAMENNEPLVIDLDGARGYGSSFLEEAFGGLVRQGYALHDIHQLIKFKSRESSIPVEINEYMTHANA